MVKLLIVDDEDNTRIGLKRFVPWDELGIDEIYEAEDGITALEVFDMEKPDILLCDVRMPRMNGIDLAEKVRNIKPGCKIVFLSGFSDKEYLKSAIKLGAVDYIEKPVVLKELKVVMENAVKMCRDDKLLNQKLSENINVLRQKLVTKLVSPDSKIFEHEIAEVNNHLFKSELFTVITVLFSSEKRFENIDKMAFSEKVIDILNKELPQFAPDSMAGFLNSFVLVVILNDSLQEGNRIIDDFLNIVTGKISDGFHYTIGIGKSVQGMENINSSYKTSLEAAEKQFFAGYEKVIFYETMNNSRLILTDENIFTTFESCLMEDKKEDAKEVIHKLTSSINRSWGTDINYVKHLFLNLYLVLCRVSDKRNCGKSSDVNSKNYFWKEISDFGTLNEISEYVLNKLLIFFDTFEDRNSIRQKAYEIITLIEKYYSNKDISVKSISEDVHLSINYMCSMFKKCTGKTVNYYIQEVRIQKACELLKNRNAKLYEIANMIGFTDSNYFSRIFKKEIGMTPSDYREKCLL